MATDTQARLTLYKAQEARILNGAQSVTTDGLGGIMFPSLVELRAAITELELKLATENRAAARRRGPRMIVSDMRRVDG